MGRASRAAAKFFAAPRDDGAHRNRYEASRLRRGRRGRDMTSKDNFEFAHAHRKEVAWMSQNTNTLPVHPAILDAIRASADEQEFNLYPRKAGVVGLSEAIKEDLRLDDVEMILTNGGIEGEYIATRALLKAGDHVLATDFYPEKTLLSYSFSKAPGLAGMRIGAILGPPAAIQSLRKYDTNVLGVNVLAQRAALAALRTKKAWLPGVRKTCERNQETIRRTVAKVDGASLPVYPSKANMFVIDLAPTGVNPEAVEERLLLDHLVHTRAGSYLSKKHGGKFLRVSFTVSDADCARFAQAFPAVMNKLAA